MSDTTMLTNRPGLIGWLCGGMRGVEGYVYLLHRTSGIVLLLFVTAHILLASSRLLGTSVWAQLLAMTTSPAARVFQYVAFVAFAFHAFNGVRLILVELGVAVGRSERLVYPYRGSIHKQRPLLIAMMVLAAVLLVLGGFDLLRIAH